MPWETGPLSPLFTAQFNMHQKTGLPGLPLVGIEDVSSKLDTKEADHEKNPKRYVSLTSFVKNRIAASKFTVSDEDLRVPALGHFRNLICSDLKGTTVGLSLLDKAGKLCAEDDLATTASDTLAHKSTGTLLKRVSFDVLVSLVFYIGTSYLMNVHFGSKDFHLSCFGISLRKNHPSHTFLSYNKVRAHICMKSMAYKKRLHPFKTRGLLAIRDFSLSCNPTKIVATSLCTNSTK